MARKKRMKYTPVQIKEGAWYRLGGYTHTECCDCALVHREEFKIEKGVLYWRAFRDDKRTREQRAKMGIRIERTRYEETDQAKNAR